jgi:hypothetical protein
MNALPRTPSPCPILPQQAQRLLRLPVAAEEMTTQLRETQCLRGPCFLGISHLPLSALCIELSGLAVRRSRILLSSPATVVVH